MAEEIKNKEDERFVITTFYPKDENGNKVHPTETFYPKNYGKDEDELEIEKAEKELQDAQKDLHDFYEKELMDPKKGTVKTIKAQLDQIQYVEDRKKELDKHNEDPSYELPKVEEGLPDDNYVSVVTEKTIRKQVEVLQSVLKLNKLSDMIKTKHVYNPTERDVKNQIKRTMKFMIESDYDIEVATIGFYTNLRPTNLYNVYNILNTISRDNPYITKCNRDFMIRLCKVIRASYNKERMYLNTTLRAISNIPIFYSMKSEVGIEESKELLMNLNKLYEELYLKHDRENKVKQFGLKTKAK